MSERLSIAIVGGGVSGALTAVQLARIGAPADVLLIDRCDAFARGVAYTTPSHTHLLNVPAARMSALPDQPDHFVKWTRRQFGDAIAPDAFISRPRYGDYIADLLNQTCEADGPTTIRRIRAEVIDIAPGHTAELHLADRQIIRADRVVCASGHTPPVNPPVRFGSEFYKSPRYHENPWDPATLGNIQKHEEVLLVGVGLTMYDVALSLRERGHRGTIHAFSRRGLTPRSHAPRPLEVSGGPAPETWLHVEPTARALLRAVRNACDATAERGDWRAVIDSIRPVTAQLWKRLSPREQARFYAQLRPFWDVHRHRAAVEIHRAITQLAEQGHLQFHTGRLEGWRPQGTRIAAQIGTGTLQADHVINCTGPDTDISRTTDRLTRSLLDRGLIVRDHLGLGAQTAPDGGLLDSAGRPSSWLFTIGPWRRAELWESIAVPELRVQAAELAVRLSQVDPRPRRSEGHRRAGAPLPSISD